MANTNVDILINAKDNASGSLRNVQGALGHVESAFGTIIKTASLAALAISAAAAAAGTKLAISAIKGAAGLEQQRVAFTTLLGSAEAANNFLNLLKEDAAKTPFELVGLVDMNQALIGAGMSSEVARETVLALGDALAATGKGSAEMQRVGNTISQVFGKGKADAVDFKELVNAGWITVRKDVSETLGITVQQLEEMVSAGEVGFGELQETLKRVTGEGGRYFEAMKNQSLTFNGIMSTLKDNISLTLADIAEKSGVFQLMKDYIDKLNKTIDENKEKIIELAAKFGKNLVENLIKTVEFIINLIQNFGKLKENFINLIKEFDAKTGIITGLKQEFSDIWQLIKNDLIPTIVKNKDVFIEIGKVIGVVVVAAIFMFLEAVKIAISLLSSFIDTMGRVRDFTINAQNAFITFGKIICSTAASAYATWFYYFERIKNAVIERVNSMLDSISSIPGKIADAFRGVGQKIRDLIPDLNIPGFATGVQNFSGGVAMVGEKGPELVNLPRGSDVMPAGQTSQMLGGRSVEVNFNNVNVRNDNDLQTIIRAVKDTLTRESQLDNIGI